MKRIICGIMTAVLLIFSVNISCFAESANLLKNPGFESGKTSWTCTSDVFTIVADSHSGSKAMNVKKDATRGWFSLHQYIQSLMTENGIYIASCYIKGTVGSPINLTLKFEDKKGEFSYLQSKTTTLSSEYQKLEITFFYDTADYKSVDYYFYTGKNEKCEITVDDCSLVLSKSVSSFPSVNDNILRQNETQIGAIRWDAYYATSASPTSQSVSDQVARTLSYYQSQAPFYAEKSSGQYDVKIKFASSYAKYGTTYSIDDVSSSTLEKKTIKYDYGTPWETEARYAYDASINYFAYLWYKSTDKMSLPRKAHVAKDGYINETDQLKMCAILEFGHFGKAADITGMTLSQKLAAISVDHKELYQAMASSCYLKVQSKNGNMPILYFYQASNFLDTNELPKIIEEAKFYTSYLAVKNPQKYTAISDIYSVAMASQNISKSSALTFSYNGFHAVSNYALSYVISADEKKDTSKVKSESITRFEYGDLSKKSGVTNTCYSIDYASLAKANANGKPYLSDVSKYISSVPTATAGWSCVPRIKTGVSWTGDYSYQYVRPGTANEIAENVRQNLMWVKNNPDSATINNLLIYAWNEHDEGGYICPTAKVDSNNNIIFDENGQAQADTSILDAVSKVIKEFRAGTALKGDVNGDNRVNPADRIILSRYLAGWNEYSKINTALSDIDSSNSVSTLDRVILSRYLAGWNDDSVTKYFIQS